MLKTSLCLFSNAGAYDVAIIGGGPGGYVAAIRAAQLGLKTACIENGELGGTCLQWGCIPSKCLLNATHQYADLKGLKKIGITMDNPRVDLKHLMDFKTRTVTGLTRGIESLFKKNGTEYIKGRASFLSENEIEIDNGQRITAKRIIIATGSEVAPFPGQADLPVDGEKIVSSDHAISFSEVPEKLVVIGGGVIGLELGSVWARLGSKVTVIDHSKHALSAADSEIALALIKSLQSHEGITFKSLANTRGLSESGNSLIVDIDGKTESIDFDKLLISTGRRPVTRGLNLDRIGITTDKRGFIEVNAKLQTKAHSHIFAIGDVAPGPMLAHKAEEEGTAVIDFINDPKSAHFPNHLHIPSVIYTHPEVAWVGYREDDLVFNGIKYRKGSFPFMANSRARCNSQPEGLVKVLVDEGDKLLGAHIFGANAGELIAPLTVGITYGATSRDIANVSHPHPTMNEAIREACLAAHFKPTHL
jgi:dihydrolipoamide dehydrogenase